MVYILCLKHKKSFSFIEIIEIFVDDEKSAYLAKAKFNETRPSYAMAAIETYETKKGK